MQPAYPELMESVQRVARVVKDEEHRYATTFQVAEKVFNDEVKNVSGRRASRRRSPSSSTTPTAWRSTSRRRWRASAASPSTARASSARWTQQRERARASWKGAEKGAVAPAYQELLEQGRTKFLGYEALESASRVVGLLVDQRAGGASSRRARSAELVLDQTPFYAEAGGQVGDRGALYSARPARRWRTSKTPIAPVPGLDRPPRHGATRRSRVGRRAARRGGRRRCATPPCATTPPRTCCTPRCARCSGTHVKQAGSVVEPGAPALRLHALRRHGPRRDRGSRAARQRADPAQRRRPDRRDAARAGRRHRRHGAVRREVRRAGAGGFACPASARSCAAARTSGAPATSASARSSTRAASRRACGASRRSPARRPLRQYQESYGRAAAHRRRLVRASEPELIEHVERLLATERALEKQVEQLKNKLAQAAVRDAGEPGAHLRRREGARRAPGRHGPPADARAGRFAAQQVEDARWWCWRRPTTATSPSSPPSPRT